MPGTSSLLGAVESWLAVSDRRKEISFAIALIALAVSAFAVGEVVARWRDSINNAAMNWAELIDRAGVKDDDGRLLGFRPHSSYGRVRFNQHGFRGPDIPEVKPANVVRLAFLGDSKLLNAEVEEDRTVAHMTSGILDNLMTRCRVDYVSVAGPNYAADDLVRHVQDDVRFLDPDMYLVLTGSLRDVLAEYPQRAPGRRSYLVDPSVQSSPSVLLHRLQRYFHASRELRRARREGPLEKSVIDEIASVLPEMMAELKAAIGSTPTLAIGYRGMLREGQDEETTLANTRSMRAEIVGMTANDLTRLTTRLAEELEAVSASLGWTFSDAIADIPATYEFFADGVHLNANGIAHLSSALGEQVVQSIRKTRKECF
jgi:hypothetical protein